MYSCKFSYSALGKSRQSEKRKSFYFGTQQKEASLQRKTRKYDDS